MKTLEVCTKIKEIRESKKLSQDAVAFQLGISSIAYHKLETGKTQLNLSRLEQIAQVLETSLEEILGIESKTEIKEYHNNNYCSINGDIVSANEFFKVIQEVLIQNQELIKQNQELVNVLKSKN